MSLPTFFSEWHKRYPCPEGFRLARAYPMLVELFESGRVPWPEKIIWPANVMGETHAWNNYAGLYSFDLRRYFRPDGSPTSSGDGVWYVPPGANFRGMRGWPGPIATRLNETTATRPLGRVLIPANTYPTTYASSYCLYGNHTTSSGTRNEMFCLGAMAISGSMNGFMCEDRTIRVWQAHGSQASRYSRRTISQVGGNGTERLTGVCADYDSTGELRTFFNGEEGGTLLQTSPAGTGPFRWNQAQGIRSRSDNYAAQFAFALFMQWASGVFLSDAQKHLITSWHLSLGQGLAV